MRTSIKRITLGRSYVYQALSANWRMESIGSVYRSPMTRNCLETQILHQMILYRALRQVKKMSDTILNKLPSSYNFTFLLSRQSVRDCEVCSYSQSTPGLANQCNLHHLLLSPILLRMSTGNGYHQLMILFIVVEAAPLSCSWRRKKKEERRKKKEEYEAIVKQRSKNRCGIFSYSFDFYSFYKTGQLLPSTK